MRYLTVDPSRKEVRQLEIEKPHTLEELQDFVGGWIEGVARSVAGVPCMLIVNEEGALQRPQKKPMTSWLLATDVGVEQLRGPALLFAAECDGDGQFQSCDLSLSHLKARVKWFGANIGGNGDAEEN